MNARTKGQAWGRRLMAVGAAVLLGGAVVACGDGSDAVSGSGFRSLPADQVAFNLEIDIKDLGVLRARLHADTAYIWEDSAKTLMFPVDLKLYDDNGAETAHLTAEEGELDTRTDKMVARRNVLLVSLDSDRRILTEELHYDPGSGQVWSDVHTIYFDGPTRMEGNGFRADDRMQEIDVFQATVEDIPFGT
jgi:LPS export ABC transporter protein LptC